MSLAHGTEQAGPLGCGVYDVLVTPRGGGSPVAILDWTQLNYGRVLDEVSTAKVSMVRCDEDKVRITPWTHELAFYRDEREVWAGPITERRTTADGVDLEARDLFTWFERRRLNTLIHAGVDLAEIFEAYALDALSWDTTPNITVVAHPTGVTGDRGVSEHEHVRAADAMRELARTGVDFTLIGRRLFVGGLETALSVEFTLLDAGVTNVEITETGLEVATEVVVHGERDVFGVRSMPHAESGWLSQIVSELSIKDVTSAESAAQTRLDIAQRMPVAVTCQLTAEAAVGFAALVPGARANLRLSEPSLVSTLRLAKVGVSASATGTGNDETVSIELQPLGTVT